MDTRTIDVKVPTVDNSLKCMFERQLELLIHYQKIEGMPTFPLDINTFESQRWLKDFLWRTFEELTEAYSQTTLEMQQEELIDAFHFWLEMLLLAGIDYDYLKDLIVSPMVEEGLLEFCMRNTRGYNNAEQNLWSLTLCIGRLGSTLKNKSWKKDQVVTDQKNFNYEIRESWFGFMNVFGCYSMTAKKVFEIYWKKSEVNLFRIRSGY